MILGRGNAGTYLSSDKRFMQRDIVRASGWRCASGSGGKLTFCHGCASGGSAGDREWIYKPVCCLVSAAPFTLPKVSVARVRGEVKVRSRS